MPNPPLQTSAQAASGILPAVCLTNRGAAPAGDSLWKAHPLLAAWLPALSLTIASLLAGCSTSTSPASCEAAAVGELTVTSGLTPTFSWAAACPAIDLAVFDPTTGAGLWEVHAGSRQIAKPVTYGVLPPGATQTHSALTLQTGATYGVYLSILAGGDTLSAVFSFTP
jgi:hypothetical protein